MTKVKKFKNFVKEHAVEIIGSCLVVVGVGLGVATYRSQVALPKAKCREELGGGSRIP